MTDIKEVQKKLVEASKRLTALEEALFEASSEEDSLFKIPVFFTETFFFEIGALGKQEKTIVNGADDAYITKIVYNLSIARRFQSGSVAALKTSLKEVDPFFEFRWNYRLASTQARYLSRANSVDLASRNSLGYADVGLPLTLAKPLYFAAGDAISLEVEALLNKGPDEVADGRFVHFTLCGYRNGVMA